jgi:hypothetical protein
MNGGIALTGYSLPLPAGRVLKTLFRQFTGIAFNILCHGHTGKYYRGCVEINLDVGKGALAQGLCYIRSTSVNV